jgi:hypothetical protein
MGRFALVLIDFYLGRKRALVSGFDGYGVDFEE